MSNVNNKAEPSSERAAAAAPKRASTTKMTAQVLLTKLGKRSDPSEENIWINYCEMNGWERETWSQYYSCNREKFLCQVQFIEHFLQLYAKHFAIKHAGEDVVSVARPCNTYATKFLFRREFPPTTGLRATEYKSSNICEFIGDEIPHYCEIINFLRRYKIKYPQNENWAQQLDVVFADHKNDAIDRAFGMFYKNFGSCSSRNDYVLIETSPDDDKENYDDYDKPGELIAAIRFFDAFMGADKEKK